MAASPAQNAHIVKYYVDAPSSSSGDETGNLHILYSDKTEVSDTFRPKRRITDESNNVVYNQRGITDVKMTSEARIIGCIVAETIENGGTLCHHTL